MGAKAPYLRSSTEDLRKGGLESQPYISFEPKWSDMQPSSASVNWRLVVSLRDTQTQGAEVSF